MLRTLPTSTVDIFQICRPKASQPASRQTNQTTEQLLPASLSDSNIKNEHTPSMQNILFTIVWGQNLLHTRKALPKSPGFENTGTLNKPRICKQCDIEHLISQQREQNHINFSQNLRCFYARIIA